MKAFQPAYSQEALAALSPPAERDADELAAVDRLGRFAIRRGDSTVIGSDGREYQLRLLDDLLLTHWVDDAAREIRILTIEWPD